MRGRGIQALLYHLNLIGKALVFCIFESVEGVQALLAYHLNGETLLGMMLCSQRVTWREVCAVCKPGGCTQNVCTGKKQFMGALHALYVGDAHCWILQYTCAIIY